MAAKNVRMSFVVALACAGVVAMVATPPRAIAQSTVASVPNPGTRPMLVTVSVNNVLLKDALELIARQAGLVAMYGEAVEKSNRRVSVNVRGVTAADAFERALAGTGLTAIVGEEKVMFGLVGKVVASVAQGGIAGKVVDAKSRQGLRGATVTLGGTNKGTTTRDDGSFRLLDVAPGSYTIHVRMLGYLKSTKAVTVDDGQTATLEITMDPSVNALDQIIVTGTVAATELKAVPNAMTVITAKQIEERGITKIDQLFRGDVPGLFAMNLGSGVFLDEVTMFSRGVTALSSTSSAGVSFALTNPIKTYVDGVELADPKYLSQIDPKSIERIEILSGPQASTIYGSNALNGVMQIFTKRGGTGASSRPQLTLDLQSGLVENNFSSALTPQHDYSARLGGIEGKISYNVGGSWNYMGPWTPAKQLSRTGGFGGARLDIPTSAGRVSSDMTLRRTQTQSIQRGGVYQSKTFYVESGWFSVGNAPGVDLPTTRVLTGQTLSLSFSYAPASWWSHELVLGSDASGTENRGTARGYRFPSDTSLLLQQSNVERRSIRYSTTARIPIGAPSRAPALLTVTVGVDEWQNLTSSTSLSSQAMTGTLTDAARITRQPWHNAGAFLQSQLGVKDRLFFTYGLRAEWNPDYGADAQPNLAPKYGVALTHDFDTPFGSLTTKLRGSYGRSTRPPAHASSEAQTIEEAWGTSWPTFAPRFLPYYGPFDYYLANPELVPEDQRGGEGGVELYFGNRGSLVVTRYNQTVDNLISSVKVDSLRTKVPCNAFSPACNSNTLDSDGYGYWYQYQILNIGSVRNQGWELQGNLVFGPLSTRGTYSWTKSRTIGISPRYRALFTATSYPQYQPGATFKYLPEHTWALGFTYAHNASSISLNVTGVGQTMVNTDDFYNQNITNDIRLLQNRIRVQSVDQYVNTNASYALADLTASHRLSSTLETLLQVTNIGNRYTNDFSASYASLGRQSKMGLRIRL